MEIPIRPARPTDTNYITKSWVRSISGQFPFFKMSDEAKRKYGQRVKALLDTAITIVACDAENDDIVYGFACGEHGKYLGVESPTLHYVWVRKAFRQYGIGGNLVETLFPERPKLVYTHITKFVHRYGLEGQWNLGTFDPYFVEGALYSKARKFDAGAQRGQGGLVLSASHGAPTADG